jgi:hypothetical protein
VGGQFMGHRLTELMKVSSGEADLWLAVGAEGRRVVIKLYRWEARPKPEIVEKLGAISLKCVVEVYERGVMPDGRHYEVLEHVSHGSLADLGRRALAADTLRLTLIELTNAVAALHSASILHRDLKPANILVRTLEPLDLVLTDFGISSVAEISLHATSVNRTAAYSAPEALAGVVSRASDWWSIGVILLELLIGRHPFADIDERAVNLALVARGISVPDNLPSGWEILIRGLLTRDYAQRWGEKQVRAWLSGKRDIPVRYIEAASESPTVAGRSYRPYKFMGIDYSSPAELAEALANSPGEGVKYLSRGLLTQWVKDEVKDFDLTSYLMDLLEDKGLTANQRLSVAILAMNPKLPLTWCGEVVNQDWFVGNVIVAIELLESSVPAWLEKLRGDRSLADLVEHRRALVADLKQYDPSLDKEVATLLTVSHENKAQELAEKLRRQYAGSSNPRINRLFQQETLRHAEAVGVAACQRNLLMTEEQAEKTRIPAVQKRANELGVTLDLEQIVRVVGMNKQIFVHEMSELCQLFVDSTNAKLTKLLQAKEPGREGAILLLSCSRSLFRTPKQFLIANVLDRAQELGVSLDHQQMVRVVELNDQMLVNEISDLRELFVDSTNARLRSLLRGKEPSREDSIVLLSCGRDLFRTPNQILVATVQEQARQLGIFLDLNKIARVIGLSEQMIVSEMKELRRGCVDSTNDKLTMLLQAENSTWEESMLLLSCDRSLFRTSGQILIATVQDRANKLGASLDPAQLELVVRLTTEQIVDLGREMQKRYAGSINAGLRRLLNEEEPSREDFMVLLSCERRFFCLTRAEFLAAGVKERAEEMGISLDMEELTRVVQLDDMEIRVEMREFRKGCVSSKNVKLAELLKMEQPGAQDSMFLLSCQRELTKIRSRCIATSGCVTVVFMLGLIITLSQGGWGSRTCLVATLVSCYCLYRDIQRIDDLEFTI